MDFERPLSVITASADGDILAALARLSVGRELQDFSPATIARVTGTCSPNGVRKALARLVSQGIVLQETSGSRTLFAFNIDHLAAPAIMALVQLRLQFHELVADELSTWVPAPAFAALLGPELRVLVVVRAGLTPLAADVTWITPEALRAEEGERLRRRVRDATGNELTLHEFTETEATERMADGDPLLNAVAENGEVIAGPSTFLRTLLYPWRQVS